jgi:hypothetical protein
MATREEQIQIANTIIGQLGGFGKLKAMTGAKDISALDSGVQFSIGRNAASVNRVRITLNGLDLYDLEFGSIRKKRNASGYSVTIKAEHKNVYNDQLTELFEQATGMRLSLF